jgi:hypothetical protein
MLFRGDEASLVDATTIDLIAERVRVALRGDLEALAAELLGAATPGDQLTVDQVARRLGVARSTVYAHWREWGGYKLGTGAKAPIRFDSSSLPIVKPEATPEPMPDINAIPRRKPLKRPRRRDLLVDAPRLVRPLDGVA